MTSSSNRRSSIIALIACIYVNSFFGQAVVSLNPNGWTNISRFERFEIGLAVPPSLDSLIEQFLIGAAGINPYDYKEISIKCAFAHAKGQYMRDGYYTRDIIIDETSNTFTAQKSNYPFRIRFAPPEIGEYSFLATLFIRKKEVAKYSGTFSVVENSKRGFLSIGRSWHLKDFRNAPFIGIGQSIPFCEYPDAHLAPDDYSRHRGYIQNLADNGGNLFRLRLDPWCNEVELEELGVYGSQRKEKENYQRQWQAYEVDRLFATAESNDTYIFLTLLGDTHFKLKTSHSFNWDKNPYRTLLEKPEDFFDVSNEIVFALYKNKLRYLMARYGYSANLAFVGLINETDHIEGYDRSSDVRRNINKWVKTVAAYLKEFYPQPLLTNGYAASPKYPDMGIDNSILFDILTTNHYSNSRRAIKERHDNVPTKLLFTPESSKPFIYGEMGSGLCDEDKGHPEWFSDADYHNNLWSSAMYHRALGTAMYWWDWEQDSHLEPEDRKVSGIQHRKNFRALNTFFSVSPPPFGTEVFYSNWDSDLNIAERLSNRKVEWIENINSNGTIGFGWIHNSDYFWINDPLRLRTENCSNCKFGGTDAMNHSDCYEESGSDLHILNEPKGPYEFPEKHETVSLNRFRPFREYLVEIWSCYGNGGLVTSFRERSDALGCIKFKRKVGTYPGDPAHGDPDFAYKVSLADQNFGEPALIYPNPFHNYFDIRSENEVSRVIVYDGVGVKVKQLNGFSTKEARFFFDSEPAGLYFIHVIFADNKMSQFKLIKE